MDLSKLPRLSDSRPEQMPETQPAHDAVPPSSSPKQPTDYAHSPSPRESLAAEVWLSLIVGLILMMMGRSFGGWLLATVTGRVYHSGFAWDPDTGPRVGDVPYWEVQGYYALSESAIFLFGLAMILEAIALLAVYFRPSMRKPVIAMALLIALVMTIYNAIVAGLLFNNGTLPLISMLAVAFGGYMVMSEWNMLKREAVKR